MVGIEQSPPTTSGVVVISGSNNFDPATSDFGVVAGATILYDEIVSSQPFSPLMTNAHELHKHEWFSSISFLDNFVFTPVVIHMTDAHSVEPLPKVSLTFAPTATSFQVEHFQIPANFIPSFDDDIEITSTSVTTSGVVIVDIFPGAASPFVPFVPPIFINQRVFPVTFSGIGERLFPEENRRIYPVLPQFSVITPGD